MESFEITYQPLSDFCRCVDKMSDNKHVFFRHTANNFRIYAKSTEFYADYIQESFANVSEFGFGLDSKQFIAIIKKADKKKPVVFSMEKARLVVSQGNVNAKLPMLDTIIDFANLSDLPRFDCPGFLDDLEFCSKSVKEDKRFRGVVVESFSGGTRLAKIGFASCGTSQLGKYSFGDCRFIVSTEASLLLKGFDDENKKSLILSDNVFGVEFKSGVTLYTMLLADQHPQELFQMFGNPDGVHFQVNRKDLVDSLEMISSVMQDEMATRWDYVGEGKWKISSKTYKGAEVSEIIFSDLSENIQESFGTHRKALLDVMKSFDKSVEVVTIYVGSGNFSYVSGGDYVAALTKMSL